MPEMTLPALAKAITSNITLLTTALEVENQKAPSFQPGGLDKYPEAKSVQEPRQALIELANDLYHLALGPGEYIKQQAFLLNHDRTTLEILSHFDVYQAVPVERSASYEEIAERTQMPISIVKRYLRHAYGLRIFKEVDGRVAHTAASAYAGTSQHLKAWVGHCTDEISAASIHEVETIKHGDVNDVLTSAWLRAFDPKRALGYQNMFDHIAREGEGKQKGWRERRFGEAMTYYTSDAGFQTSNIHECFDWDSLGSATIVDIGGSTGHLSFELASEHPDLKMVVQDYAGLEKQFRDTRPKSLEDRVSFQAHDFFTKQPIQNAHYLMKHILHDWPDKYNIDIIRNILPAMGPESRIFVVDSVVPKHGELPYFLERYMTALDLQMELASRSRERSAEEWEALFSAADSSLHVKSITQPPDCAYALIKVVRSSS